MMSAWPKVLKRAVWLCSDGKEFLEQEPAVEYEQLLGLKALCIDVFGADGSGHYGSLNGADVYRGLLDHRDLFLQFLQRQ